METHTLTHTHAKGPPLLRRLVLPMRFFFLLSLLIVARFFSPCVGRAVRLLI